MSKQIRPRKRRRNQMSNKTKELIGIICTCVVVMLIGGVAFLANLRRTPTTSTSTVVPPTAFAGPAYLDEIRPIPSEVIQPVSGIFLDLTALCLNDCQPYIVSIGCQLSDGSKEELCLTITPLSDGHGRCRYFTKPPDSAIMVYEMLPGIPPTKLDGKPDTTKRACTSVAIWKIAA